MLLHLQISCLLNSKATFQTQTTNILLQTQFNPYLLPKEKQLCDSFHGELINIQVTIGPYTFTANEVIYTQITNLVLKPSATDHSTLSQFTVARFSLTLTTQLIDQSGQIDSFVIRQFDRNSCFELAQLIYSETSFQLTFGRQNCEFDAGDTQLTVQIYQNRKVNNILNQSLGNLNFEGIQSTEIVKNCGNNIICLNRIKLMQNTSVFYGFAQFSTAYSMTKKVKNYNISGYDNEVEEVLHFQGVNIAQLEYAKSSIEIDSEALIFIEKSNLEIVNFPILNVADSVYDVVINDGVSAVVISGIPYTNFANISINCSDFGCVEKLKLARLVENPIIYMILHNNDSHIFLSAMLQKTCVSGVEVQLYKSELCANLTLFENCEFDFGVQQIEITGFKGAFIGNFQFSNTQENYCFRAENVDTYNPNGHVIVLNQNIPFNRISNLQPPKKYIESYIMTIVTILSILTASIIIILKFK